MDSNQNYSSTDDALEQKDKEAYASVVDPFLIEALQNPRHRLTVLRMELDIQRFLQSSDQNQFEFQYFPTSYLRLAAHRVAQHYGLQTMVQDNGIDGVGTKIVVRRTAESRYPAVCLSEIPAKQLDNDKGNQIKIVIRPRPNNSSQKEPVDELGLKRSSCRSVEERKEEYDRARARIFSSPSSEVENTFSSQSLIEEKKLCLTRAETASCRNSTSDSERNVTVREGSTTSRVAIFRDREKDRTDPDYDRSYERYVRNFQTNPNFGLGLVSVQKIQPSYVQYDSGFPHLGQMPSQASVRYGPSSSPIGNAPLCTMGLQTSGDGIYIPWPSPSMMYAQTYEQFRHTVFQAPFSQQQPLSFDYSQNH